MAVATSSTAGSQCRLTCHAACSKRQAASSSALRKFNSVPQKFENFVNKTLRCALCCRREARRSRAVQGGAGRCREVDETRLCRTFGNSKKESKRRICQLQCAPKLRQTLKGIWHCFQLGFSCGSQRIPAQRRLCRGFTVHTASDAHPVSCCCCTKFATRQMVLVVLLLLLLSLNLPLQWLSCCRGRRGGCSDWTEYNNNNAFVNCPADVCLSSRHPCCHRARRPARVLAELPACSSTSVCRAHALIKVNCTSHKMAATAPAAAAAAKENCCLVNITTKLRSLHSLPLPCRAKAAKRRILHFI